MKKILTATLLTISLAIYAASSFTPHFNLELPADGDANWGNAYRSSLTTIDSQMYINQQSIADHISDTAGAHLATAISAAPGPLVCTFANDVQEYLDCLDSQIGTITGGEVATTNTNQTITGQKTFTTQILANAGLLGNVTGDLTGNVTGDVTGDIVGNLTGNVNGTLTGNVTGDVSGTAGTFTGSLSGDVTSSGMVTTISSLARSKLASGTAHRLLVNNASGLVSELGPLTNGQLLVGSTGAAASVAALTGTANQVTVTNGAGSITLSTPQNIATTSSPTFAGLTVTGLSGAVSASAGVLSAGTLSIANGGTNSSAAATAGGVGYGTGTAHAYTTAGTSGQFLQSNGASAPAFVSVPLTYSAIVANNGSTCAITNQIGGTWLSSCSRSASVCTCTVTTSWFSAAPNCAATNSAGSGNDNMVKIESAPTTTTIVWGATVANTGAAANATATLFCQGSR